MAQGGFVYLAVLLFVALFGAISAGVVVAGSSMARRAAEEDLLFSGLQFRAAIRSYYEAGAGGRRYALSFDELLRDKRAPGVLRHLRRSYLDPLTGKDDWGTVRGPDGGIIGIYSTAPGTPIKVDGFAPELSAFKGQTSYSGWVFSFVPAPANPAGNRLAEVTDALASSVRPSAPGAGVIPQAASTPKN